MLLILQYIILGIIQGVTEWLPISSSGMLTLVMVNFFNITDISVLLQQSLFLHLGTFFAALIYFRHDVAKLITCIFNKKEKEYRTILKFLVVSTIITGIIGLGIVKLLSGLNLSLTGKAITLGVGLLLLITGGVQLAAKKRGAKNTNDLTNKTSVLAGFAQGLSVLPGLSRSGITVSTLLLDKFDDTTALRLSFLMSLPVVLLGNILLNLGDISITFTTELLYGLLFAFVFGIVTIHLLINLAKRINFAWFAIIFGILMMLSILI
jgi:undecaprenyl-diphosphatase